jgi:hypothetical protein
MIRSRSYKQDLPARWHPDDVFRRASTGRNPLTILACRRLARKLDLVEYTLWTPVFGCLVKVAINTMRIVLDPFRFVLIAVAGWMNQRQLQMIEYLREENRVLREQLGERRLRLTDDQRRRLAVRAKGLGRKLLAEVATIVTPATLLRSKKLSF